MYIAPDNANAIKIIGRKTTVNSIFVIPHAALIDQISSFPKTMIINIIKISVSENCRTVDVTFSEAQHNSYELALRMAFYLSGDKYQLYAGTPASEILTTVNYIDAATGEIFAAGNSGEMNH